MSTVWHFFAVRAPTPAGFRWYWQSEGAPMAVTSGPFDFYYDCLCDARRMGYTGPLPTASRLPLPRLPGGHAETALTPPGASSRRSRDDLVMQVKAVSSVEVERRRHRGRVRVS